MLWDAERREVVCNESIEIIKYLCSLAEGAGGGGLDLWPPELRQDIDRWYGVIYPSVNNGVYRCGFAQSQEAYDAATRELFGALDRLDAHLAGSRYLCGATYASSQRSSGLTSFTTRCSRAPGGSWPSTPASTRDIYQMPKVAETCDMEAIMVPYFKTLPPPPPLNPGGIQPLPPASCDSESLSRPHGREALSSAAGTQLEAAGVS